jgi:hypothetical protein
MILPTRDAVDPNSGFGWNQPAHVSQNATSWELSPGVVQEEKVRNDDSSLPYVLFEKALLEKP